MKKFMKAFAVFAAMAMLAGSFISCSSDDEEDTPAVKPADPTPADPVTPSDPTPTDPVTPVDPVDPVTPTGPTEISISATTITTEDCSAVTMGAFSSGAAKITAASAATLSNGLIVYSPKEGNLRFRGAEGAIDSVNFNGGFADAGSIGDIGTTLAKAADRYVAVTVVPGTTYSYSIPSKVTVVAEADLVSGKEDISMMAKMGIVDSANKVLAVSSFEMNGKLNTENKEPTLTGTFTATDDKVFFIFSREGTVKWDSKNSKEAGSGGFDIKSITLTPAE